ncbi:uncharacterized protein LOC130749098 isoform X1 [Lotus japonicus]|uniref:uncharacterized protein LOC130749098 isoform X1 n=1 Tax=Lotus japonicus TaxID=34305 RepID=UPI00258CA9C4|nr:uncharacterized protein LOC130749098 isoform X1 [Lotus japonicus]
MELDLNQEPLDPTYTSGVELGSSTESAHVHIEDHFRHLEAVTSRARQRLRLTPVHSPIQITNFSGEATTIADVPGEARERREVEEKVVESGRGVKRSGADLIAKALGLEEPGASKGGSSTGNFFDCNICLEMARDPVLTCCGHLFCWPCFYKLSYAYSNARECPVCNGEVTEADLVPIYGKSSSSGDHRLELEEAGLSIPPRPMAQRVDGIRQQLVRQGASSSIVRHILQFHNLFGGERVQSESPNTAATDRNNVSRIQSQPQTDNNQHPDSNPISRLLVQRAASFSSISSRLNSAMDSAERLVQDLESYIHRDHTGESRQLNPPDADRNPTFSATATNRSESLTQDVAAANSATATSVSPISSNVDTVAVIDSGIQTTDDNVQIRPLDPSTSSWRTDVPRERRRRLR